MKKTIYILGIILSVFSISAKAQISITSSSSCLADTLTASLTGLVPVDAGITDDDGWSSVIPIGFTYKFYGNNYTQCIIGSNGCLGFDIANATYYNTWPIGSTLLTDMGSGGASGTDIENMIAGPWCDIYIPAGGTIMYSTVGTAPNRKFEVTWCGTAMYSCTTQWVTSQIIIYETTGVAEVHIGHHTFCTSWNGGYAEVGVKNSTGSAATVAPGRDFPSNWNATNEAWRFTPVGTTSYTCSAIPYAPIPYAASTVYWYDSATHAYITSGLSITVTPSVTTTYEACAVGCLDTSKSFITMYPVGTGGGTTGGGGLPHISYYTFTNPSDCGLSDGTITLHGIKPGQIDTVFETIGGVPQPPVVMTAAADSILSFTGLAIGTYTFYVKVGTCPSNTVIITLVTPVLAISGETFSSPTFCGKCDGSITIHGLWPGHIANLAYNFDGVASTYSGMVAPDSTLTMSNLCTHYPVSNFTPFTASIGTCTSTDPATITLTSPPINDYGVSPSYCGSKDGFIKIYNLAPDSTYHVTYTGAAGSPVNITVAADDTLTIPYLSGGTYGSLTASLNIANCPATPITLTTPPIAGYGVSPTICGQRDGYIKLYNLPADSVFTVTYTGALGSGVSLMVGSDDTLTIPYLSGGTFNSLTASLNGVQCTVPPITLTNPTISATSTNPTICGKPDGVITLYNLPADSTFSVSWTGGAAGTSFTSPQTDVVGSDDSLRMNGLIASLGSFSSILATINISGYGSIQCPLAGSVTLTDPTLSVTFDTSIHLSCKGDYVTFTDTSNQPGYASTWTFGDGTAPVTTFASSQGHTYYNYPSYIGTYPVHLSYQTYPEPGCTVTADMTVPINHGIAAAFAPQSDTVCLNPNTQITFVNTSFGIGLSYSWNFGDGSTSNLATPMYTYKEKGGNYITQLTVTDFLGCDSTVYGNVDVISVSVKTVTHDTTVCLVEPMEMIAHPYAVPGTYSSLTFEWSPATFLKTTTDTITYFWGVGDINYTITTYAWPLGCIATDTEMVHSLPPLTMTVTPSQTIMFGSKIQLNADGADYYTWLPADGTIDNTNINNPTVSPRDSTTYTVYGMNAYGCKDSLNVTITIDNDMTAFIPSGFSPNGDGLNDKFRVTNLKYQKLVDMKVFNRWGNEVFHTTNPDDGWDGTFNGEPQDIGNYTYVIILAHPKDVNKVYTGMVTLVR